jgi:anti-sigma factor RsiW
VTHDELKDLAMALHDGQISPSDKTLVEIHLAGCGECRRELRSWERAAQTFFPATPVPPSEIFVHRVMREIAAMDPPSAWSHLLSRRFQRWAWAGTLAVAAAALWLFLPRSPAPPDSEDLIAEMADVSVDAVASETEGYGTAVETYLL